MARKPVKLTCRIVDIQPDPKMAGRHIVSVEFRTKKQQWFQPFSIKFEESRAISLEEFMLQLKTMNIEPPTDPLKYLKEAMDSQETFELELDD